MRCGAGGLVLAATGATAAVALLLATTRPLTVVAGFVSGVALGGASVGTLVLLGRAFVTSLTKPQRGALMALQFAKWPLFGGLIYLLLVYCQVDPIALAIGFGAAMLVGLATGLGQTAAKAGQGPCR